MLILGIDTSCDDTCAAVVRDGCEILSNIISSQIDIHSKYGGIVPEIASRKHIELINYIIDEALETAQVKLADIDGVAVTNEPGLIGALLVGLAAAKSIAYCCDLPLIGINHIKAHIYANFLGNPDLETPHISLVVSGGHTLLASVESPLNCQILGSTLDDAAGEAFDKIAKFRGLGFPGGPIIDELARDGDPSAIAFPRPILDREDFSFSGLKTAVINYVRKADKRGEEIDQVDLLASFQQAIIEVLTIKAIRVAQEKKVRTITLGGGVAANSALRRNLSEEGSSVGIKVIYPPLELCTDNAAMIAGLGYHKLRMGIVSGLDLEARANVF